MGIEAKIVLDSVGPHGIRLTTFQLKYHRYIHGEVMTHRVFSRNASSSRAIPIMKTLAQVWHDPAMPVHWGANQAGMQAKEQLTGWKLKVAKTLWKTAAKAACVFAYGFMKIGLHKQLGNRILEPWQYIHVILSATEWDNFYALRDHPDAQPEIAELAVKMKAAQVDSIPTYRDSSMGKRAWHLPYVSEAEFDWFTLSDLKKISTARNARVSYLTHDGENPDPAKDIALHDRLVGSIPIHASPTEHIAYPVLSDSFFGNFKGWWQYRKEVEADIANKETR